MLHEAEPGELLYSPAKQLEQSDSSSWAEAVVPASDKYFPNPQMEQAPPSSVPSLLYFPAAHTAAVALAIKASTSRSTKATDDFMSFLELGSRKTTNGQGSSLVAKKMLLVSQRNGVAAKPSPPPL